MFYANRNTSATCAGALQQAFLDLAREVRQLTMRGACAAWRRLRCFLTAGQTQAQLATIQRRINNAMRELSDLAALSLFSGRLRTVRNSALSAYETMHGRACTRQWCSTRRAASQSHLGCCAQVCALHSACSEVSASWSSSDAFALQETCRHYRVLCGAVDIMALAAQSVHMQDFRELVWQQVRHAASIRYTCIARQASQASASGQAQQRKHKRHKEAGARWIGNLFLQAEKGSFQANTPAGLASLAVIATKVGNVNIVLLR